ncbi:four helix bundle protein [Solitalea sp. MAHUQ-68]|uniref:Four helix bundle protein n=1 Tax=Solitalea agri TaxID=2953739 RepID=A0A9X2JB76_9SPHI|nr:four helix bundle protein [Solitalea agri]MCO4292207.1 four helix bundle protein [Solitalea agri]
MNLDTEIGILIFISTMENNIDLKLRTKKFGLRVIKLVNYLPNTMAAKALGNQLLRSATSVGANYRAACRAKSTKDFINKLKIVEEESDECQFWLELLEESEIVKPQLIGNLKKEASELTAIFVTAINSAKRNMDKVRNTK